MAFKTTLLVCGLLLSVQNVYSQRVGLAYNGLGNNALGFTNGLVFGNALAPSYSALDKVDISGVDVKSIGLGAAYEHGGLGLANAGAVALGSASAGLGNAGALGVGATGLGVAGAGNVGLSGLTLAKAPVVDVESIGLGSISGYGGFGLANAGAVGLGSANIGLSNAGSIGAAGLGVSGISNAGLGGVTVAKAPLASSNVAFLNLGSLASGGLLPINSYGSVTPAGLTVVSDNVIEGVVALNGQLPFLTAVAFEGALPSSGSGLSQCGCGSSGNIGIINESVGPVAGINGLSLGGLGLNGLAGRGLIL